MLLVLRKYRTGDGESQTRQFGIIIIESPFPCLCGFFLGGGSWEMGVLVGGGIWLLGGCGRGASRSD